VMLRLGVDAWNLPGDHRGIGRYLREILRVWWTRDHHRVEVTLIVPEWHTWTVRRKYLREVDNRPYRIVSRELHWRAGLDALWFPFNGCSWSNFDLPAAATLHDASNFAVPDYAPETQKIFEVAAQLCRLLITDSHFAQSELARELHVSPERIVPIPLGVGAPRAHRPTAINVGAFQPYVLYVGAAERRKGFDTLLGAMEQVVRERPELTLAVTTTLKGWHPVKDVRVVELGYVGEDQLAELYRHCTLLVFPSRYEGFGLPVLEAMSYGAPVVASDAASVPEVGGDAACYFQAGNEAQLAAAIVRVASDPAYAAELRRRGPPHAAQFTWERTASLTLDALEKMLQ
jgi:glycosyltransferase involved in cell wall biosynthesis